MTHDDHEDVSGKRRRAAEEERAWNERFDKRFDARLEEQLGLERASIVQMMEATDRALASLQRQLKPRHRADEATYLRNELSELTAVANRLAAIAAALQLIISNKRGNDPDLTLAQQAN